ncbi:DNA methylase [Mediterraneibacter gnavus]|uniref:Y-family DNA polymerase n=1 Tax=Mediterraneibacter gnavus TaxID=33038 RepID=UPI0005D16D97
MEGVIVVNRTYIAIDLKSFYASVECIERGLDPLTTNLVVADNSRTEKTICLAVTPSLKSYGVSGRPRLFEVVQRVREINATRLYNLRKREFSGFSYNKKELDDDLNLKLDYIVAPPRMAFYMEYSTRIYSIYLKYVAPEDIHVYSIDEVFMDVTSYLNTYGLSAKDLTQKIILDVLHETGITATAGIGTNLYLCKIAMDIVAKHIPADKNGVRIAELDEISYRKQLWDHRPLTDFWRIGRRYTKKLESVGLYTMGDIARCSLGKEADYYNEDLLRRMFGKNTELLIDHAWGYEPVTIVDIKNYKPDNNSIGSGQVLHCGADFDKTKIIVREMTEMLVLDLVSKNLVTDQLVLTIGYDRENLLDPVRMRNYKGEYSIDQYGRKIPKHAHGTINLDSYTSSTNVIVRAVLDLFNRIVDVNLLVRRINMSANHVIAENEAKQDRYEQINLFDMITEKENVDQEQLKKEKDIQKAVLDIKKKFGKNAILKGMSLQEGATAIDRNNQIGGHKA